MNKEAGYSLKNKFNKSLHSTTLAQVRKFDLDQKHVKNKTKYEDKKRPYGKVADSSSDDEDYQYKGKAYQKKELISPVKEKDYLKNHYTEDRDKKFNKKFMHGWLGKTKFVDELSSDDDAPKKRNMTEKRE